MARKKNTGEVVVAKCGLKEITQVENRIFTIRGEQVILDSDLAKLYGTVTKRFNEQVQRNIGRFPTEFMFQLSMEEFDYLRSQNAATNLSKRRSLPLVFTEHGVIMAAAILKSEIADRASVKVVEAFVAMRRFLAANAHQPLVQSFLKGCTPANNRSTAQTSQVCVDIGAGLQGKRPKSAQTRKACDENRPYNALHGAGPRRFGRLAPKSPQTCDGM